MSKTVEELEALLEDANRKIEALVESKSTILDEKKKLEKKYREIDTDEYFKLRDDYDKLEGEFKKLEKANATLTKDNETLTKTVSEKDENLSKLLIDDGIAKTLNSLEKHKLNDGGLELAMLAIKNAGAKLEDGVAMVGDKPLDEYIKTDFLQTPYAKNIVTPNENVGGGANGSNTSGGSEYAKYFDKSSGEFNLTKQAELKATNPELYSTLKGN